MTKEILLNKRYRIGGGIGAGGMGIVYTAYDLLTKQDVALKRLNIPSEYLQFSSLMSRSLPENVLMTLAHEFQILSSIRHPHIVSVLDYGFDLEQQPYFTMELLSDARPLLVASIDYTIKDIIKRLIEILLALAYLHRRGVVHRDLKPDNVLIYNDRAKVLDFGLAVSPKYNIDTFDSSSGTITHMAPEVLLGGEADSRSDLYAVGIMAYEMLTGRHPFNPYELDLASFVGLVTSGIPDTSLISVEIAAVILRLTALDPDDRYVTASEAIHALCRATGIPVPSETTDIRNSYLQSAEFTGRKVEFEQLSHAVDETIQTKGCAWLVTGESGVGKTRLINELRTYSLVNGVHVLHGQVDRIQVSPYQPWRGIIRWLTMATELSDTEVSVISSVMPDIATFLERTTIQSSFGLDADKERQRLYYTIQALINRIPDPIVIIMEDLHWADSHTLDLLNWLSRFVSEQSLMIIGSYRNDEAPHLHNIFINWNALTLNRLQEDDIKNLAQSMLGNIGTSSSVIELINRETEGNAFFMVEVVRALAEEFGRLDDISPESLPNTVVAEGMVAVLERRINRVTHRDQPLLELAAILGRYIDERILYTLNDNKPIEDWLLSCSESAVVDFDGDRWRFSHDKLRDAIVNRIDPLIISTIHETVATAIENTYDNLQEYANQLAYHWQMAGHIDNERKYLIIGGNIAQTQFANAEAIQSFQRALDLGGDQLELSYSIAQIYRTISQWDKAIATLQNVLKSIEGKTQIDSIQFARCQALLGDLIANYGAEHKNGLELLELSRSIFAAHEDFTGLIDVYSSISSIYISQGNNTQGVEYLDRLIDLASNIGDFAGLSDGYRKMGHIYNQQSELDKALESYHIALEIAEKIDDTELISRTYFSLGVIYYNRNDLRKSLEHYRKLYQLTQKIGDISQESETIISIGSLYERDGDYVSARRCCEYGLSMSSQLDDQLGSSIGLIYLALSSAGEKDIDKAINYAELAIEIVRRLNQKFHVVGYLAIEAQIYIDANQLESALEVALEVKAIAEDIGSKQYIVEATLIINYAQFLLDCQTQEQSISNIEAVIDESLAKQFKAEVYYILWKIKPEHDVAQELAKMLYQELIETSPVYLYRSRYAELTNQKIVEEFQLPPLDTIISQVDTVSEVYLNRIRTWLNNFDSASVL